MPRRRDRGVRARVTFGVTAAALATGAALFPIGSVALLSGTTVSLAGVTLLRGLLSFGLYLLLSGSIAWARFTTADVTC